MQLPIDSVLPHDILLRIAACVECPLDRASLALALPSFWRKARPELRHLYHFDNFLFCVAFELVAAGPDVDEAFLRRFAADRRATAVDAIWLNAVGEERRATRFTVIRGHSYGARIRGPYLDTGIILRAPYKRP